MICGSDHICAVGYDAHPELLEVWLAMPHLWPEFMLHTQPPRVSVDEVRSRFSHLKRFWIQGAATVVGHVHAVALRWDGTIEDLPRSWNGIVERAVQESRAGIEPNATCALGAEVHPDFLGLGLGARMLADLKAVGRERGLRHFLAPVRPSGKADQPSLTMQAYLDLRRDDGLPRDPWLRCHLRSGARLLGVMRKALVVQGSARQWREWTGVHFEKAGAYFVPGALFAVPFDGAAARYEEDGVWVHQDFAVR